ncbi:ANF_receptor domain-containing protein [Caerostris darwini]|uniref:ANF_receptor domain-containing protein n=1 Tax=Caerostris darwini TaxID=1538125 RepID=A0AAV4WQB0_9ARAC|nr:ANF_receptor domain-containing protein [Caerostris darwini]
MPESRVTNAVAFHGTDLPIGRRPWTTMSSSARDLVNDDKNSNDDSLYCDSRCSDSKVSNKEKYTTFARTLPPSSKVCKSLISLLKYFKWERLMLLVANDTSNMQIAEALSDLAQKHDVDIVETFFLPGDYLTKDNTTLKNIVLQTYTRTRGTFLCFLIFYCPGFRP